MDVLHEADIIFNHLIDLPNCDCVFCSAKDKMSGETRLFLIFSEKDLILMRNGVKDNWGEIRDLDIVNKIKSRFKNAIERRDLPCFST